MRNLNLALHPNPRRKPYKPRRQTLLSLLLTAAFWWTAPTAHSLTTNSLGLVQYQSFQNQTYTLKPWLGTNIAILTPTNAAFGTNVMTQIVTALDKAYDLYRTATGRQPNTWEPTTLYGRDTISVVSATCGAGCGYLGFNGIEILPAYFDILYNGVATNNQYDQVLFYELGRNFWFYSEQLQYLSPDSDPVVTGFAVYMRFISMDAAGVAGGPFNGHSFTTFRTTVTNLMDSYIANSSLNWGNTFRTGQAPSNPLGLGGADLIASLLMRIGRDFGGPGFPTNFWRYAEYRRRATTTQTAVDNFIFAACAAVNQNLTGIFSDTWKFPVSSDAIVEAQLFWGAPIVLRPAVSIAKSGDSTVRLQWQSQVNTSYQIQSSTNLQSWSDVGSPLTGDGTIRTVTNSTTGFPLRLFRLKLQ